MDTSISEVYRTNIVATANVLDYCLNNGVSHLIFASSQAVYGSAREATLPKRLRLDRSNTMPPAKLVARSC